jgi:central kinetochore subunit Mis15/CHL4
VRLTFHGSHVFAGIRQLVECGIVDGERMPGWMTGEEGVTIGAVRNGRIRGHKGSGL